MRRRILVIEDEQDIANLIELHLRDVSSEVAVALDGAEGLARAMQDSWDLIVLDLRLPGVDGLEICRQLRSRSDYTPILMLTSRSSEVDRVLGLEMGADDYLTKPFSIAELLARVKAIFRRVEALTGRGAGNAATPRIAIRGLSIDTERREVMVEDRPVNLTAREFALLVHFARNPGKVYSRAQLLDRVWGYGHDGYEHTVNSHINRLRSKVEEDPAHPRYIVTVWGVGYKFAEQQEQGA